ncbi:hypothetical protein, partial [Nocardioides kribbensis]|uniref:hypothetical protein n=1 Tax=Nocardioides kribbensis TaxID=305517 RepID=UPI0032DB8C5A
MADATPDEAGADLVDRWLTHRDGGADARAAELRRQGAALRERTGRPAPPEDVAAPASERLDSTTNPAAPAASRELDAYDAAPARPLPPSGGIRPGLGLADFEPVIIPSARRPK